MDGRVQQVSTSYHITVEVGSIHYSGAYMVTYL